MKWDSAKNYSDNDMMRMQQDAIRRVKEMQLKAEKTLQNANSEHGSVQAQQIHNETLGGSQNIHGSFEGGGNHSGGNGNNNSGGNGGNGNGGNNSGSNNNSGNGNNSSSNHMVGVGGSNNSGGNSGNNNSGANNHMGVGGNSGNNHIGGSGNIQAPSSVSKTIDNILDSGSNLVSNVLSYFTGTQSEQAEEGELSPIASILKALHLDSERLIVLGLLVVLMNEKADKTILLALFYLLF